MHSTLIEKGFALILTFLLLIVKFTVNVLVLGKLEVEQEEEEGDNIRADLIPVNIYWRRFKLLFRFLLQ